MNTVANSARDQDSFSFGPTTDDARNVTPTTSQYTGSEKIYGQKLWKSISRLPGDEAEPYSPHNLFCKCIHIALHDLLIPAILDGSIWLKL